MIIPKTHCTRTRTHTCTRIEREHSVRERHSHTPLPALCYFKPAHSLKIKRRNKEVKSISKANSHTWRTCQALSAIELQHYIKLMGEKVGQQELFMRFLHLKADTLCMSQRKIEKVSDNMVDETHI